MSFSSFLFFEKLHGNTHYGKSKKWVVLWQDRAPLFRPKLTVANFLISPPLNADEYIAKIVEIMGGYLNPYGCTVLIPVIALLDLLA
jgi:hypothetical protein